MIWNDRIARLLTAIGEVALPPSAGLPGAGPATLGRMKQWLFEVEPAVSTAVLVAAFAIDAASRARHLRAFASLSRDERSRLMEWFERSPHYPLRATLRAVLTPLKFVHFDDARVFARVGCRHELPVVRGEQPRWLSRVTNGRDAESDLHLQCEVVVVGTGAGGAAAAHELASRGRAVVMLEEGDLHRRSSLNGSVAGGMRALYRDRGWLFAIGGVSFPVFVGRAVGGTTLINSGTCYRAPESTLRDWRDHHGLPTDFSSTGLDPYYRRVESMLGVAPTEPLHAGKIAPLIARAADEMGLRNGPIERNAPGCDGQGLCCFGCPTGAKRSTDVSYVPEALLRGAELVTAAHVERVEVVKGRARGVTGKLGSGRTFRVEADAVIVAGGALMTPLLLSNKGVYKHPLLGKNLSLHPASKVFGLFDQRMDQCDGIPQSHAIDQHIEDGMMFEGSGIPPNVAAAGVPWTGPRFMDLMANYPHLATFALLLKDQSRGEVRRGLRGSPLVRYSLCEEDVRRIQRGLALLCEVFQRAGARRVLPLIAGHDEVSTPAALEKLRSASLKAGDLEITAYHPLGTCRIGSDPETSCLDANHEVRGIASLLVCDGSAFPSALGVNPQMTIMATALRAAEILDTKLG